MDKFLTWIGDNSNAIFASATGVIAGFAICLPFHSKMPDSVINFVGSVAGSVATIGGAVLLWKLQEQKTAFHTLQAIRTYAAALWTNSTNVGLAVGSGVHGKIVKAIDRGRDALRKEATRVSRIHNQLHTLSTEQSDQFYELETLAEQYEAFCEEIYQTTAAGLLKGDHITKWTPAMERHREGFAECIRDLQNLTVP